MTISYSWLSEYLPEPVSPEYLSEILTSVGLEVEKMEVFEEIKGELKGLVIGEVLEAEKHPNADKLTLTKVSIGNGQPLQIVCGAPNVAKGQKVVVAPVGTTIYPVSGDPITMKVAKIRGVESQGMICAEDEIGLGTSHAGILVLPDDVKPGQNATEYFCPFSDIVYEIGLTPNRMDAMSHWGVARDVCAYLSHHEKKELKPRLPQENFKVDKDELKISVTIDKKEACRRYSGVCIAGVQVQPSPKWLKDRLASIGLRSINNIVDITNFIQHETGQPLHAFDFDAIDNGEVIVKTLPEGTSFITLDEKERKLSATDLMICNSKEPMCIAGVFGGIKSGVTGKTTRIFLESAWFDPVFIRRTSFRHGLRTDAATRFEKGIDISNTVPVLKRAALLIREVSGGYIASDIIDVYPDHRPKNEVSLEFSFLKKLSGKDYPREDVKKILKSLGFTISKETNEALFLEVPYHKPDVSIPADLVEEILRIDGLDNIEIPEHISMAPSVEENHAAEIKKEKISNVLAGAGFTEILTNSITNSAYFPDEELKTAVKLLNNLSSELNIMRPSMIPTALEVIAFNTNRKNSDLRFFEFGKTYSTSGTGQYNETNHLCLYSTGNTTEQHWKEKGSASDIYFLKGMTEAVLRVLGIDVVFSGTDIGHEWQPGLSGTFNHQKIVQLGRVSPSLTSKFDIRQPVFMADIFWDTVLQHSLGGVKFRGVPKYPAVERDLAMVIPKTMKYGLLHEQIEKLKLEKLKAIKLFDVFESEKLGAGKKSLAVNFTFVDEEKTLTDKEIDAWMTKIMSILEKELGAEIRK